MEQQKRSQPIANTPERSIYLLLRPYTGLLILLTILALLASGVNLLLPKIISQSINMFIGHRVVFKTIVLEFFFAGLGIFIFTYLQSIVQTFASERVGRDLRKSFAEKISRGSYLFIEKSNPSKLLTNLTSDTDAVKMFVAQAVVTIISSVFLIIGTSILLILINWRLALAVLTIVPILAITFFSIMRKIRPLFLKSRENIDWLNKVINESILGSATIRVLNSQAPEYDKFLAANTNAKDLGLQILRLFASMIPIIMFVANIAVIIVLALGGHFVIAGTLSLGDLAAFNSYIIILIFPVMIIGFMTNVIARAQAAYGRLAQILDAPEETQSGNVQVELRGDIELSDVVVSYGDKEALKGVSFSIAAGTRTAIVGPTAAGKTQILYLLTALIKPDSGAVKYDGRDINEYDSESLHHQTGFVFQDSILFNMSLRENIALSSVVTDQMFDRAIQTAELKDFIETLPDKLNTIVSERGTSLSGGQKQRIMLARALALNPKVLLLDDFTARVDAQTEHKILENIQKNYPKLTLVSVTQKIAAVEHYDQIILIMEGEILAKGTHKQLMQTSPEYVQIYNSQKSTNQYELQT